MILMDSETFLYHVKDLGKYIVESEFELVESEYNSMTLEEFKTWIKQYQYYNALVCITGGNDNEIEIQLQADYDELEELGDDASFAGDDEMNDSCAAYCDSNYPSDSD